MNRHLGAALGVAVVLMASACSAVAASGTAPTAPATTSAPSPAGQYGPGTTVTVPDLTTATSGPTSGPTSGSGTATSSPTSSTEAATSTTTSAPAARTTSSAARRSATVVTTRPASPTPLPATSSSTPQPAPVPPPASTTAAPRTTSPRTSPPAQPPAPDFGIPVSIGNATQIITVAAPSASSTVGTLRAWQRQPNGTWTVVAGPVTAHLGSEGIGTPSEYHSRTPQGTYTLTQAFGRLANPGTALPYHRTGPNDWWVSDVNSPDYNTMQTCAPANCPFNTADAEHLYYVNPEYDYAVVMDVNRWPAVPGGGSAFFLHVTDGSPTAGCVAIDPGTLVRIMDWLNPAGHPRIAVGIG